jgi:dTDP-glucose 4,6-dehydratase
MEAVSYQFPEKFMPKTIIRAMLGLHVYGSGRQVRNWIYVKDHCEALELILQEGRRGRSITLLAETS